MEVPRTPVQRIGEHAARTPTAVAVWGRVGPDWRRLSWALYWSSLRQAARGLVRHGLRPGGAVALVGGNRPEWAVAQHGVIAAGGIAAPLGVPPDDEELAARITALGARIVLCDTVEQLIRLDRLVEEHRLGLKRLVVLEAVTVHEARILTLDDLMSDGAAIRDDALDARLSALALDDPALRLPDGSSFRTVAHRELLAAGEALLAEEGARDARIVSHLPPASLAEQATAFVLPALTSAPVWFVGDEPLAERLVDARPTLLLDDARGWLEIAGAIDDRLAQAGGLRGSVTRWAATLTRSGGPQGRLARRLVLDELRASLGLDALQTALTIDALDPAVADVLRSVGIEVRRYPPSPS